MKTVFITGINRGLGRELFNLFLAKGYMIFGVLRNVSEAQRIAMKLPDNGKLIIADLSNDASIASIQSVVKDTPINLLINNAGVGGESFLIDDMESEEIQNLFNIHCLGVFRTVKALKTNLIKSTKPIVLNLNSRFGSISRQNTGAYKDLSVSYSYRIAKAAQNMLTICLRNEFEKNIKFISLHPGKMKTDTAHTDADIDPDIVAAKILDFYEGGKLKEENGILEMDNELIDW